MEIVSNLKIALWLVVPKSLDNVKSQQVDCFMERHLEILPFKARSKSVSGC